VPVWPPLGTDNALGLSEVLVSRILKTGETRLDHECCVTTPLRFFLRHDVQSNCLSLRHCDKPNAFEGGNER
jgi:hypothetical protein